MAKNTLKPKIKEKLENEKKWENLQIHLWEYDSLAGMSMVEALPTSLLRSSGWDGRHQKIGRRRTSWLWVPLEKMIREWEKMREFKRMRELGSEEKKEERAVFVERKKKSYGECEEVREMKRMKKMKKKKNGW